MCVVTSWRQHLSGVIPSILVLSAPLGVGGYRGFRAYLYILYTFRVESKYDWARDGRLGLWCGLVHVEHVCVLFCRKCPLFLCRNTTDEPGVRGGGVQVSTGTL